MFQNNTISYFKFWTVNQLFSKGFVTSLLKWLLNLSNYRAVKVIIIRGFKMIRPCPICLQWQPEPLNKKTKHLYAVAPNDPLSKGHRFDLFCLYLNLFVVMRVVWKQLDLEKKLPLSALFKTGPFFCPLCWSRSRKNMAPTRCICSFFELEDVKISALNCIVVTWRRAKFVKAVLTHGAYIKHSLVQWLVNEFTYGQILSK